MVWVQCPLSAANRIVEKGKIQIGWINTRVTLLEPRPLQCFRCLERGHVRDQCKSDVDRSRRCYRCGKEGHKAQQCDDAPKCPMCADLGRPANHRAGNKACTSARIKRRTGPPVKTTKVAAQEPSKTTETPTGRKEVSTVEMMDTTEQPKPQRVRSRLPRLKDTPSAEMMAQQEGEEKSQDTRDRELRAAKAQKTCEKATRRRSDSEGEEKTCEPEDSRHEKASK